VAAAGGRKSLEKLLQMDRPYRVHFSAAPILVHAPNADRAREIALRYALQPNTARIIVEEDPEGEGKNNAGNQTV